MKQKNKYQVLTGVINSRDPNSGAEQLEVAETFTNLKEARKYFNQVKRDTSWSAPWATTQLVKVGDVEEDSEVELIAEFVQKQKMFNKLY